MLACRGIVPTNAFERIRPIVDGLNNAFKYENYDKSEALTFVLAEKGMRLNWGNGDTDPRPDLEGSILIEKNQLEFRPYNVALENGKPVPYIY